MNLHQTLKLKLFSLCSLEQVTDLNFTVPRGVNVMVTGANLVCVGLAALRLLGFVP